MKTAFSNILAAAGTAMWVAGCFAGESFPSLDELLKVEVEGASRYAQPLSEAPASATVITAEDMARHGHETLADALSMARGVYATNDYTYTYLGIRGFNRPGDYNSRVLMMVDGARYNDAVYDQAMVGNEAPIDLSWVKRVEFVPGPSSALYGGNAMFGMVNAMLWTGADLNGTRIISKLGSAGLAGISMLSGRVLDNGGDWVGGVSIQRSAGNDIHFAEFDVPGVSDGVARGLDGEHSLKAFARYSNKGWRLTANYAERYKDVPSAFYGTVFGAAGNFQLDRNAHLDLTHATSLSADWGQFGRLHAGWYTFAAEYIYPTGLGRDEAMASWWSGEYQLSYRGLPGHQIQFGVEGRRNSHMDQRYFDINPRVYYLDDHRSSNAFGAFLQDEWHLSKHWITNLGYRLDKVGDNQTIASPSSTVRRRKPQPSCSTARPSGAQMPMSVFTTTATAPRRPIRI